MEHQNTGSMNSGEKLFGIVNELMLRSYAWTSPLYALAGRNLVFNEQLFGVDIDGKIRKEPSRYVGHSDTSGIPDWRNYISHSCEPEIFEYFKSIKFDFYPVCNEPVTKVIGPDFYVYDISPEDHRIIVSPREATQEDLGALQTEFFFNRQSYTVTGFHGMINGNAVVTKVMGNPNIQLLEPLK